MAIINTADIETSPRVGLFFGSGYKTNIPKVIQDTYVFGFAWKEVDKKKIHSCFIWDFPLYKKEPTNDIEVCRKWDELIMRTDIGVGQNILQFDEKVMTGRRIIHDMPPIKHPPWVDTLRDLKQVARYDNNGLDHVSKLYGQGGKVETGGIDLWWECLDIPGFKKGNPKAQKKMVFYCKNDVGKTEDKYLRERPHYKRHPAMNTINNRPDSCPKCGGTDIRVTTTYYPTKHKRYQYFRCASCRGMVKARNPLDSFQKNEYVS